MPSYGDARQLILDLRRPWEKAMRYALHWWDGPFARDRLLGAMLWEYNPSDLRATKFINYSAWKDYYGGEAVAVSLAAGSTTRLVRMPYSILIDLVQEPNPSIVVEQPVSQYEMPETIRSLTEANLRAYLAEKKRTFDGRVVRLEKFERVDQGMYMSTISRARYWDQARTNLTIDLPLHSEGDRRPLRERDLGPGGSLCQLSESMLLNSIGVSAIVGYRDSQHWQFFCKLRRADDAVAERMLGSTAGVAELLPGQHVYDLMCYAEAEMIREFYNESGISCEEVVRIVPLAFCRELVRGGKPQFMFFIEIQRLTSDQFARLFKGSAEGLDEFYNNWLSAASAQGRTLSFEYAFNLSLTLQFLQRERHQPASPVQLKV